MKSGLEGARFVSNVFHALNNNSILKGVLLLCDKTKGAKGKETVWGVGDCTHRRSKSQCCFGILQTFMQTAWKCKLMCRKAEGPALLRSTVFSGSPSKGWAIYNFADCVFTCILTWHRAATEALRRDSAGRAREPENFYFAN